MRSIFKNRKRLKIGIDIPTRIEDLSLKQILSLRALKEDSGDFDALSILSGIDIEILQSITEKSISDILTKMEGLTLIDLDKLDIPQKLEISGRMVNVPDSIDQLPFQSVVNVESRLLMSENPESEMAYVLGQLIYMNYSGDEKFNESKAEALGIELESLPGHILYPVGAFFLRILQKNRSIGQRILKGNIAPRSPRQGPANWKSSGYSTPYQHSQGAI